MDNVALEAGGLIEQAAELWRAGILGRDIAEQLGITGRRLANIAADNRDLFPSRRKKEGERTAADILNSIKGRAAAAKNAIKPAFPAKAPGYDGVTARNRPGCGCEFPLWGHHEEFDFETSLYCGAPRVQGKSYCGFHCKESVGAGTASERGAAGVLIKAARAGA